MVDSKENYEFDLGVKGLITWKQQMRMAGRLHSY